MTIHKLFLFAALLVFVSCESALQENPETFFNEEQIFGTEDGVEAAVNGLYSAFYDPGYYGSALHGFIMPVSGKFWSGQGASRDATSLNTASNNTWLVRMWPAMYRTVNTANVIIANLEDSELENRNTALGQAYFIRALTYFDLVRFFGDVPLRTAPVAVDQLDLPRTPKTDVYALIIADLERARDLLPEPGTYIDIRPTPITARAYLARVYLTMASSTSSQSFYELARTEALAVVASGQYSLTPTYGELFDFGNENTSESIFEIQYGQTGGLRNSDVVRIYTPKQSMFSPANVVTFGRVRPNKETFDSHVTQYPGDPRIDGTYIYDRYVKTNGREQTIYPTRARGNDGYAVLRKYLDPSYNGTTTNRNLIHFRYADILLMLAEIENELSGPAAAYDYVNQVLDRAADANGDGTRDSIQPMRFAGMTQDEFRTRILKERQYELMGEGHSWFDTRRFDYDYFLNEVVLPHNSNPTFDNGKDFLYPEDPKNMLLPLPSTELAGNQAIDVSDQNPGY